MLKVTIIIPTLNEEEGIGKVLNEIPKELDAEILIVDGNSTDRTVDIAKNKGARVIIEERRGYGRAYKSGFEQARGEIIVTLDGDNTYPAWQIPEFLLTLEEEKLDFITTDRLTTLRKDAMTKKHRFGNFILSLMTRILFNIKVKDSQSGMWIFRKSILPKLNLVSDGMSFSEEIKIEAFKKFKCKEVPIDYRVRLGEVKLSSWKDGWNNLKFLFWKRFKYYK